MGVKFLRIEQRAGNLVAVFDRGYQQDTYWYFGGGAPIARTDDGTFALNEESLRARIANIEREGRDASVEHAALAALTART